MATESSLLLADGQETAEREHDVCENRKTWKPVAAVASVFLVLGFAFVATKSSVSPSAAISAMIDNPPPQGGGTLTIYLDKMINLKDADAVGYSDPYVVLDVGTDYWYGNIDYGTQKSTIKWDDLNPTYDETVTWDVPSVDDLVLTIDVWDKDPLSDDRLGKTKIDLGSLGLSATPTGTDRVIDSHMLSADSRIFLQLSYN